MTTANRASRIRELIEELLVDDEPPAPEKASGPILHTTDEAAELLHISKSSVIRAMGTGDLKSVKIGKLVRITRESIDEFVAAHLRQA